MVPYKSLTAADRWPAAPPLSKIRSFLKFAVVSLNLVKIAA